MKMREDMKEERPVHAYNMARRIMVERTITNHRTLKAFSIRRFRNIPFSFSTARI
jgi:hypothetical protein